MPGFEHIRDYPYPTGFDSLEKVEGWARDIWRQLNEAEHGFAEDLETTLSQKAYFKTITGITNDVVADQQDDTLTLATGNATLGIVGTAATDTITWTWAHLGFQLLSDPGADRIPFWDDGESALKWLAPDGTTIEISGTTLQVLIGGLDHGGLSGLGDDDHTIYILHSLAGAANDFLVASGANTFVKQTLAQTGAILEGDIDHGNIVNTHNLTSDIDHGSIGGLDDGDHNAVYYTETEINTWRNSVTQTEMGYVNGITSDIQTQLDARCLESVLGTSIGAGLLLDGTVLKTDIELQAIAGLTSAADRYIRFTGSGTADLRTYANVLADLSGQAGAAFAWNSQNLTGIGTIGCGNITGGTYNALTLAAVTTGFTIAGGTTPKTLTMNDDFNVSTQLTAIGANTTHRGSVGTDHGYIDQDLQVTATVRFTHLGIGIGGDSIRRIRAYPIDKAVTGNEANYFLGGDFQQYLADISSGVTDSGYRIGGRFEAYIEDSNFEGTLTNQFGLRSKVGIVEGIGTVVNSYALFLENVATTGIVTHKWGVYQDSTAAKNYFGGIIFIATMKAGANQGAAGAAANELWRNTADNSVMIGV